METDPGYKPQGPSFSYWFTLGALLIVGATVAGCQVVRYVGDNCLEGLCR
jgi:glutaredoxin-related protein